MFDKEIKEKWITALKSSDYTHGKFRLKVLKKDTTKSIHCCFGVLCEIMNIEFEPMHDSVMREDKIFKTKIDHKYGNIDPKTINLPSTIETRKFIIDLMNINDKQTDYKAAIEFIEKNVKN